MADEPADSDANPASGEPAATDEDDARVSRPRTEPPIDERALWAAPERAPSRASLGRTVGLGLAFIGPCVVIALGVYFIVKGGGAPRGAVLTAPSASGVASASAAPSEGVPEAGESDVPSLQKNEKAESLAPGFEDEGNDEEPGTIKKAPPKHFATVALAAAGSCSTESVDGLSRQIIEQARCIKPNDFVALPKRRNLLMAEHVYPYLEVGARDHLLKALDAHSGETMTINSCLRTVAQQYLVSHWAVSRTCGVQLATPPGESNHEIGTALDIAEAGKWRPALEAQDFKWLGASDRVHFDYKGVGGAAHTATDVLAFQKLWNRNHRDDAIPENGQYNSATEQRLKKAPPGGFPLGASCHGAGAPKH